MKEPRRTSTTKGFARASALMQSRIRKVSEGRGFAVSRLLTHWAEVVGPDIAAKARPVEISYGRGGMGATLILLTTGAEAPMLEMQKPVILEKVNACYGYRAVARIHITQTAATGFDAGRAAFAAPRGETAPPPPDPAVTEAAERAASGVASDELRLALEALASNVLTKRKADKG